MSPLVRWLLRQPLKLDGGGFLEVVTGDRVFLWTDESGRGWMSTNRWGFGKVARRRRKFEGVGIPQEALLKEKKKEYG